jgi:hypothetical protein
MAVLTFSTNGDLNHDFTTKNKLKNTEASGAAEHNLFKSKLLWDLKKILLFKIRSDTNHDLKQQVVVIPLPVWQFQGPYAPTLWPSNELLQSPPSP